MCERCEREYNDPRDRRFHAQPIACWDCGPRLALVRAGERLPTAFPNPAAGEPDAIEATVDLLSRGAIVAVKGIGGFHLMADARNEEALYELRRRKRREEKPFALMSPDVDSVRGYAHVEPHHVALLSDAQRPIVLLRARRDSELARAVAPGNRSYGVMLAYTPVHHLLFEGGFDALVATSGNVSEEPIAYRDEDALDRLGSIADAFLLGERDIFARVDDSIAHVTRLRGATVGCVLRRARGYVPEPVRAPFQVPPLLAVGAELKSAICIARDSELFLSQHIGDLKNEATQRSFEHAVEHLSDLVEVTPRAIAHDLHPAYRSTRFALAQTELPTVAVQHHHAHMAACMCEHGLTETSIGVVFDGTGYGTDGCVWGGEFLVGDYARFERAAHLRYFRLLGGDRAVEEPYRVALALLHHAGVDAFAGADSDSLVYDCAVEERRVLVRMLETGLGSPLTSSMGRVFDGVASLIGVRRRCHYEAQAAIELEQLIEPGALAPPFHWDLCREQGWPWQVDLAPMIVDLAHDLSGQVSSAPELSLRFHCTVVDLVRHTCAAIRERAGLASVVLSGGVFQNDFLLRGCHAALLDAGFEVHVHSLVPSNDGGIALGQAVVAGHQLLR
jgi:hydrogenase maturation protein HypF